jgi:hypothetical protein
MARLSVLRTGSALAITAVIVNLACATAVALLPAQSIRFANSWMHAVDLQPIRSAAPLTVGGIVSGALCLAAASFLVGVTYALVYNALHGLDRARN